MYFSLFCINSRGDEHWTSALHQRTNKTNPFFNGISANDFIALQLNDWHRHEHSIQQGFVLVDCITSVKIIYECLYYFSKYFYIGRRCLVWYFSLSCDSFEKSRNTHKCLRFYLVHFRPLQMFAFVMKTLRIMVAARVWCNGLCLTRLQLYRVQCMWFELNQHPVCFRTQLDRSLILLLFKIYTFRKYQLFLINFSHWECCK